MGDLIERATETAAVEAVLGAASAGTGRSLLLVGQAGIGKSAIVAHAERSARAAGFAVLRSCSTPVSSMLPHGIVRDWLGPVLRGGVRPGQAPFDGPASALATALTSSPDDADARLTRSLAGVDYALTWVLESLSAARPLLLVVDDVHWTDVGSLQLLDLLSARLPGMRAGLLLALRSGEVPQAPAVLDRLASRAQTLEPRPLSLSGVERLRTRQAAVSERAGRLTADELHRRTGGVPYLVCELLRAESADEPPRGVVESVRERLGRLGPAAATVARMTAVLGDEASFDAVADLTEMSVADLADPLELLADAGILTLGMWQSRPAHPLVAEAILSSMSPSDRSELHRRAADHLAGAGRPRAVVASHLLHTLPAEDPGVVELLRETGASALTSGAPAVAATHLLRAVGETRAEATDPELLALAATAHLAAGRRDEAFDLWDRAKDRTSDPLARVRLLADIGDAKMTAGARDEATACFAEAVAILNQAGHDRSSERMRQALVRMGLTRSFYEGVSSEVVEAVADSWSRPQATDTRLDRRLFALAGADLAVRNQDRERAVALAVRALGDGALLREETSEGIGFYTASAVLSWSDAYAENLAALEAAIEDARGRGSVLGHASASYCRGIVHQRQGRPHLAVADFEPALELRRRGWTDFADPAVAGAVAAYLQLGLTDAALALEPALRTAARRGQFVSAHSLAAAGLVRAAHRDHERALADYTAAGDLMGARRDNASIVEWRELSVWSLCALGRTDQARHVAEEALARARDWGAPRALGFALLTRARVEQGEASVAWLREAADRLEEADSLYRLAMARLQLAAVLLETGLPAEREEAAQLARLALEYGRGHDVAPMARSSARLLARAGEPVDDLSAHPVARLTPSERKVAELAAAGDTNRQIAEKLFVTVKAVEWHLSNTYRKLRISSRTALAEALYGDPGASSSSLM